MFPVFDCVVLYLQVFCGLCSLLGRLLCLSLACLVVSCAYNCKHSLSCFLLCLLFCVAFLCILCSRSVVFGKLIFVVVVITYY